MKRRMAERRGVEAQEEDRRQHNPGGQIEARPQPAKRTAKKLFARTRRLVSARGHHAAGDTFEMNAFAVAVLGGTSLAGGRGNIGGTIGGAFVIGIQVIWGVVIIAAVVLDQMQRKMTPPR